MKEKNKKIKISIISIIIVIIVSILGITYQKYNNGVVLTQLHDNSPRQMMGYVMQTKNKTIVIDGGLKEDSENLQNKISVFSGNSGVGKSSIINALFNKEKTQEGEISKKNKKG